MGDIDEEERDLVARYSRRRTSSIEALYSVFNPAALMVIQQRDRVCIEALREAGIDDLGPFQILDVGCGNGAQLVRFLLLGASPASLHGIDLVPERVASARRLHPSINLVEGSAAALPWPNETFDLVSQFTTFSSILQPETRAVAAKQMIRVLRPGGRILWYDFWLNPKNSETHGIRPAEVKTLFPGFSGKFHRLTLAPPLARLVVRRSHLAAALLQEFPPLQSHYLAVLSAESGH